MVGRSRRCGVAVLRWRWLLFASVVWVGGGGGFQRGSGQHCFLFGRRRTDGLTLLLRG